MDHQDIVARLQESGLGDADQQFWLSRIEAAPAETRPHIVEFLATVPGGAAWLRAVQEEKERAMFTGDRGAWTRVVDVEEAILPS